MKYYSEETKRFYDSEAEVLKAEAALAKQKSGREEAAKKVEEALKKANDANKAARDALDDFCKKYGSYHTTYRTKDTSISDFINLFF